MGVPALFRWLTTKYPKIVSPVIEEQPQEVDGQIVPVDTLKPNPNGEEVDNLYLDMNGIVHPCSHPEDRPPPETEEEMMMEVFKYTDRVVNMVRPRKLLMIAIDGVAPRAKMNQQRSRRFRSAKEAKEKEEDVAEFIKMLEGKRGTKFGEDFKNKKVWDRNAITPGTPFMDILAASIRYWIAYKLNQDPGWANLKIIISDSTVPGEGEHKIMEFIRAQRSSPEHDPNTRHVIYGLDADLIMLGLATHEPHFRVIREDVFAQGSSPKSCKICGQKSHRSEECTGKAKEKDGEFDEKSKGNSLKPFVWLHVSVLREYLSIELEVPHQGFKFDLERALDDWVFMCFFVGNDFLPHLPSLEIRDNGIDTLIKIWKDNLPVMGGYVTKDGTVDLERVQYVLDGLGKMEDGIFQRRKQMDDRRNANNKRRRMEDLNRSGGGGGGGGGGGRGRRDNGPPGFDSPDTPAGGRSRGRGRGVPDAAPPPMIPLMRPGDLGKDTKKMNYDMVMNREGIRKANLENKSAAQALKSQLLSGEIATSPVTTEPPVNDPEMDSTPITPLPGSAIPSKRKSDLIEGVSAPATPQALGEEIDELVPDTVKLWEPGYRDRYYEQKFNAGPEDQEIRSKVTAAYVEGLCWVLLYYFQGCPSWTWYYPYHYAPFAQDFKDVGKLDIKFEKGIPFKPFEQLMGVLPAASKHNLPEPFQKLMTEDDSEIIDFYPEDFPIDLNGKKFAWQGVALLPFIDQERLLGAAEKIYPKLTADDTARNAMGHDVLFMSDQNTLYDDVASQFYSKKQDVVDYVLNPRKSQGLSGKVLKDPAYIPRSTHPFPLGSDQMPDLEDDRSMCVFYEFPKSKNVHKSMLLRGVLHNPPALDRNDIEQVRNRAANTNRSYGGVPMYGGGGRGRGGGGGGYNDQNNRFSPGGNHRGEGGGNNNNWQPPQHQRYPPRHNNQGGGGYRGPPPSAPLPGAWGTPAPPMSWGNNPFVGGNAPPPPPSAHGGGFSYGGYPPSQPLQPPPGVRDGGYVYPPVGGGDHGARDRYRPGARDDRGSRGDSWRDGGSRGGRGGGGGGGGGGYGGRDDRDRDRDRGGRGGYGRGSYDRR